MSRRPGLDPVVSDSINQLIRRLQERYHVTSIVVTHDMKSAFHIADHIAYLHEGRIYFYGTPAELERSTDPLIQDFLLGRSEGSRPLAAYLPDVEPRRGKFRAALGNR